MEHENKHIVIKGKLISAQEISKYFSLCEINEYEVVIRNSLLEILGGDNNQEVTINICQCQIPWLFTNEDFGSINAFYAINGYKSIEDVQDILNDNSVDFREHLANSEELRDFVASNATLLCSPSPCMHASAFPLNAQAEEPHFEEFYWNGFYYMPLVSANGFFFYYRHEFRREGDWYELALGKPTEFYAGSVEKPFEYNQDLRVLISTDVKLIQIDYNESDPNAIINSPLTGQNRSFIHATPRFPINKF